jgi:hypothetical protein
VNRAFWLIPLVTCGAVGAVDPAYTGAPVSWHFKVKVAGPILGQSVEFQVPLCARKQNLLLSNGAWSHVVTSGMVD